MLNVLLISTNLEIEDILMRISKFSATLVNPNIVYSYEHIEAAYKLSEQTFVDKENIADTLQNEFLLWLACSTQVSNAISLVGAKSKKSMILVTFDGDVKRIIKLIDAKIINTEIELNKDALKFWKIDANEPVLGLIENMAIARVES